MKFIAAEKPGPHGLLLVVTDKNILGKLFEEKRLQLDLRKEFYQGEERTKEQVKALCPRARDIHFTGKAAVAIGIELNLVEANRILWVQKVPHAEVVICP